MIFTYLIYIILGILELVFRVLPTGTLPTQVSEAFASVIGYMYVVNSFFPIDTLIYLAGLAIALQLAVFAFNIGITILDYIRGD